MTKIYDGDSVIGYVCPYCGESVIFRQHFYADENFDLHECPFCGQQVEE